MLTCAWLSHTVHSSIPNSNVDDDADADDYLDGYDATDGKQQLKMT